VREQNYLGFFLLGLAEKKAFVLVAALWPEWTWRRKD